MGAQTLLMVRPAAFGFNAQTAATNAFQKAPEGGLTDARSEAINRQGIEEFDRLVASLRLAEVEVIVVDDTPEPRKPDAIFPCNWVTFHDDGTVILYPMNSPIRRLERRADIIRDLESVHGFEISRTVDLSFHENEFKYLEGAGSLVFDDRGRCVYASRSGRTDDGLARQVAELLGYDLVLFTSADDDGMPIYHTDVVMALGTRFAVLAAELIQDESDRRSVIDRLRSTGRELVLISFEQVRRFAGNVLEVLNRDGRLVIVMSDSAYDALDSVQIGTIGRHGTIVHTGLATVEAVGGGSARCMIADISLPRTTPAHRTSLRR